MVWELIHQTKLKSLQSFLPFGMGLTNKSQKSTIVKLMIELKVNDFGPVLISRVNLTK